MSLTRIPLLVQHSRRCVHKLGLLQSVCRFASGPSLPKDIEFDELKTKLDKDAVTLIDCRIPKELLKIGMIPKSKNIILQTLGDDILLSKEDFEQKFGFEKPGLDDAIVVSCLAGIRARTAQLAMMGYGYKNVRVYMGSYEDWLEKDGPVVFPDPPEPKE